VYDIAIITLRTASKLAPVPVGSPNIKLKTGELLFNTGWGVIEGSAKNAKVAETLR